MKLELKESNSPFWVLGLDHGKITMGSSTNKPCYYKSGKKWYEFAKQVINQPGIDEVYLITGVEWDNMKGSWSGKEAGSYVQNKGKLILSKNEITSYEDKYGPVEINEGDFPKGMSKDPLPKKGVKTYTSSATTLEGDKKMKLELKENNEDTFIFESNIDSEDISNAKELWDDVDLVRKEDGKECKVIKSSRIPGFPEEFEEMIHDIEFKDGTIINNVFGSYLKIKDESKKVEEALDPKLIVQGIMLAIDNWDELVKAVTKLKELSQPVYDKAITILQYLKDKGTDIKSAASEIANIVTTSEGFDIKDDEEVLDEGATKLDKGEGSTFENAGTTWKVLAQNEDDTLIVALDSEGNERNKFVVAWGLQSDGSWNQGHYFQNKEDAMKYYEKRAKKTESFAKDEFIKNTKYCTNKYDIYSLKNNKQNYFVMKKNEKPWETKELVQTDIDGITHLDKLKLKESKIVEPIGNPQTAGSFVNIDIDLDHMEVSDFIIRLTQAIRSEQNAILEYTALRSANGITNEERTNIDSIIEEEKNHMAAITIMLYKQILSNHTENVDKANDEFVLPKFGADLFDEKSNLKESIETLLTKVEGSAIRMSDEYYISDNETGNTYHGLSQALDTIKNLITKSGDQVTIQNITLNNELTEDTKITEQNDKYNIEIDVEYDSEVANQIFDNLARVIGDFNKNSDIKLTDLNLKDGKFYFTTNKEVDEKFVEDTCKKLFDEATNYEYQINIK